MLRSNKLSNTPVIKSYKELRRLKTFEERFNYLKLGGLVGQETFGFDRYLNQILYRSREWKRVRDQVTIRDDGCDLGIPDRHIYTRITIHHLNPITLDDVKQRADCVFDLDNLICTSQNTHNAIHYGDEGLLVIMPKERTRNDTCLWRK